MLSKSLFCVMTDLELLCLILLMLYSRNILQVPHASCLLSTISQRTSAKKYIHTIPLFLFFFCSPVSLLKRLALISLTDSLSTEQLRQLPLPSLLPPTLPPSLTVTALLKLGWVFFTLSPASPFTLYSQDVMRLTALCVCGTLLAFSSLSWTTVDSDEGILLEHSGFGPCAVTLRPEGPCKQGQDESTCPYIISVPPLTVHLPKQLRELGKIVKDLQKLKDNVDQLRQMCADCTVRQTERECGRQREREHEKLNVGTDRYEDERHWLNERNPESLKDFSQECGTNRVKAENTLEGNSDTDSEKRTILEEKGKNKWEGERQRDKGVIKDEKKLQVVKKDGETQAGRAKGKDKLKPATVPTAGGDEGIVDMVIKKVVEKNNREGETDRNKGKNGKGNSKGDREDMLENGKERKIMKDIKNKEKTEESDHHVWRDETKEAEENTQTEEDRGSDGIKMSEDHGEHTNKEREQHRKERKGEMEKGAKVERNNKKPKQTESIGRIEQEKTIKEGEVEEDKQTEKEIKTEVEKMVQGVQRDSDGELASSKATERTDFASISTTLSSSTFSPRHDSMDSNEAITFASSLGSPPLTSSTLLLITGVNQRMTTTADGLRTQSTGLRAAAISEYPSPDVEAGFRTTSRPTTTATISTVVGPGQEISSATTRFTSTTSARPGTSLQQRVSSTTATATTTTPHQNLDIFTFPGVADHSRGTAKKNMSSNTKTGMKPLPGRGPVSGEKHKPAVKPDLDPKPKNTKNGHKPERAPLPDKKTKHGQKQKPSYHKPITDLKSKPGKDPKQIQIPKPDQRPLPDNLPTDQNLENTQIPKHDQLAITKPNSHQKSIIPVQRPISHQRPQTVNATDSDKDPLTDREPESVEIPIINQNSKPEKKPVHPLQTDQKQEPHKKMKSEEEPKPDQRSTLNQYFKPVHEPESEKFETTSLTPKPIQKPVTELMENSDENPSPELKSVQDSSPVQKLTPDHALVKLPNQKPKPSQKIPKINPKPERGTTPKLNQNHPGLATGQKTKPNVRPKLDQTPQTNQGIKTPLPNQMPDFTPKSVPDEIPEAESNKTSRPLPRQRPPTRPTAKPGATSAQRPKPSLQLKPSPKTKTDLGPPQITRTTSDSIQSFQTDTPPASGPVKTIADMIHSPGETEFSSSEMITLDSKTFSLESGHFPHLHTLPEDFTMSPNSRITSDLTATQPPSIQMTTSPNRIMLGILPSVIPSTSPGPIKPKQVSNTDSGLQVNLLHNVEETALRQSPDPDKMVIPVPSPSTQTTSTTSPDLRSTNPAISGPKLLAPEVSTASTRELRVKINQVAAFFNNSQSPNGRHPDRRPIEHLKDKQGGSRPDRTESKLPTLIPSKGKRYYF